MPAALPTQRGGYRIDDMQAWPRAVAVPLIIRQPVDDPRYLMLDLEFDSAGRAEAFAEFLAQHVWSSPTASPGLAGTPQTRILDLVPSAER
jgi:hypothetical protein